MPLVLACLYGMIQREMTYPSWSNRRKDLLIYPTVPFSVINSRLGSSMSEDLIIPLRKTVYRRSLQQSGEKALKPAKRRAVNISSLETSSRGSSTPRNTLATFSDGETEDCILQIQCRFQAVSLSFGLRGRSAKSTSSPTPPPC